MWIQNLENDISIHIKTNASSTAISFIHIQNLLKKIFTSSLQTLFSVQVISLRCTFLHLLINLLITFENLLTSSFRTAKRY